MSGKEGLAGSKARRRDHCVASRRRSPDTMGQYVGLISIIHLAAGLFSILFRAQNKAVPGGSATKHHTRTKHKVPAQRDATLQPRDMDR